MSYKKLLTGILISSTALLFCAGTASANTSKTQVTIHGITGTPVKFENKKNCVETAKKEIFCNGIKFRVVHDEKANTKLAPDGFGYIRNSYDLDSDYHKLMNTYQVKNKIDRNVWMYSKISQRALPYAVQRTHNLARRGATSLRFEIRDGDCSVGSSGQLDDCKTNRERAELSHMWLAPLDKTVYYAYSMFIPADYKEMDNPYQIVGQFHDNEANNFDNQYQDGKMYINVKYNHHDRLYAYLTDFTKGQWHDFVYKAIWSKGAKGYLKVTMDGKTIFVKKGQNISDTSNTGPYFKIGNYRSHLERYKHGVHPTQVLYYDEFRYGPTLDSVSYEKNPPLD